jgi:ubiquinone/menaquinone biosynthesis C-methylase UbiE
MTAPARGQEKYRDPNPVVSFVIGRFFDRLRQVMEEIHPQTVLDAGCGEGELLSRGVLAPDISPVCLDLRLDSLEDARQRSAQCRLVCGSVLSLPFASGSFDAALCLEVLEHLDDPAPAVRELSRVARRAVVLSVPFEPYFRIGNVLRGKHLKGLGDHPEHVQHWNPRTFHGFLAAWLPEVRVYAAFPWVIACCRPGSLRT